MIRKTGRIRFIGTTGIPSGPAPIEPEWGKPAWLSLLANIRAELEIDKERHKTMTEQIVGYEPISPDASEAINKTLLNVAQKGGSVVLPKWEFSEWPKIEEQRGYIDFCKTLLPRTDSFVRIHQEDALVRKDENCEIYEGTKSFRIVRQFTYAPRILQTFLVPKGYKISKVKTVGEPAARGLEVTFSVADETTSVKTACDTEVKMWLIPLDALDRYAECFDAGLVPEGFRPVYLRGCRYLPVPQTHAQYKLKRRAADGSWIYVFQRATGGDLELTTQHEELRRAVAEAHHLLRLHLSPNTPIQIDDSTLYSILSLREFLQTLKTSSLVQRSFDSEDFNETSDGAK